MIRAGFVSYRPRRPNRLGTGRICGVSGQCVVSGRRYDPPTARLAHRGRLRRAYSFEAGGSARQLSGEQQEKLKVWVAAALPRTTRQIGAWIEREFGVAYDGRSGVIAPLHLLELEYHDQEVIPRKLERQAEGFHCEL